MTTKRGRPAGAKNTPADEQIRKDILRVYKRLGGVTWLEAWVKADPKNATEFVKQGLAKVLAAPMLRAIEQPQSEAGVLTDFEAARHVAFVLASAANANGAVIEGEVLPEPVKPADWQPPLWVPPADQPLDPMAAALPAPEPEPVEQLPEPPVLEEAKPERRSLADLLGYEPPAAEPHLFGDTGSGYFKGSAEEHGGTRREQSVVQRETVVDKLRRQRQR